MDNFKLFFETSEEEKNVKDTLSKLPKSHADLIKGYTFKWEKGNCLDGDDNHVGVIDPKNKTITIAAPWRYSRQFTVLHEIAHKIFSELCSSTWKHKWASIVPKNPKRGKQNSEELWCMAYANYFTDHKISEYSHPTWKAYMHQFCKITGKNGGKPL